MRISVLAASLTALALFAIGALWTGSAARADPATSRDREPAIEARLLRSIQLIEAAREAEDAATMLARIVRARDHLDSIVDSFAALPETAPILPELGADGPGSASPIDAARALLYPAIDRLARAEACGRQRLACALLEDATRITIDFAEDTELYLYALVPLSRGYLRAGLEAEARAMIEEAARLLALTSRERFALVDWSRIGVVQAEMGMLSGVRESLTRTLEPPSNSQFAPFPRHGAAAIAQALVTAGQVDEGRTAFAVVIDRLTLAGSAASRRSGLIILAAAQAEIGFHQDAQDTLRQAFDIVAPHAEPPLVRAESLASVAREQAHIGLLDDAHTTIETVVSLIDGAAGEIAGAAGEDALAELALAQAEIGQWEASRRTAERIAQEPERARALVSVGMAFRDAGLHDEADSIYDTAIALVGADLVGLGDMIIQLAEGDEWTRAGAAFGTMEDADARRHFGVRLAVVAYRAGRLDEAGRTLEIAFAGETSAADVDAQIQRARYQAQAETGLWTEALRTAESMHRDIDRVRALGVIARHMVEAGMDDDAVEVFANAASLARRARDGVDPHLPLTNVAHAKAEVAVTILERDG